MFNVNIRKIMENDILKSLCQLAKWSGTEKEIESVKTCLRIWQIENRTNPNLMRICEEVSITIYKKEMELLSLGKSHY